ncbi:hypothetical protein [Thermosporothrix hazakensis]|nr:hypothetical protein [Thermosporothrix hazakensis]
MESVQPGLFLFDQLLFFVESDGVIAYRPDILGQQRWRPVLS